MSRLFTKFARLEAQPTAGESSVGLGLAIVRQLVEAMGGKIWCESELGRGARFVFELPPDGAEPERVVRDEPALSGTRAGAAEEILIGTHLLGPPGAVLQRGGAGEVDLGHAILAADRGDHGPQRVLIGARQRRQIAHAHREGNAPAPGQAATGLE